MENLKLKLEELLNLWEFEKARQEFKKALQENLLGDESLMKYALFLYESACLKDLKELLKDKKPKFWDDEVLDFKLIQEIPPFLSEFYAFRQESCKITAEKIYTFFNANLNTLSARSKSYFIAFVIDHFLRLDEGVKRVFFTYDIRLRFQFFKFLYENAETGAKRYFEYYLSFMSGFYQSKMQPNARVAICFYGSLRGDWQRVLSTTINALATYFNADCFIFTWDKVVLFPSINTGLHHWVNRCFPNFVSKVPHNDINDKRIFCDIMPHTFKKLCDEYFVPLGDAMQKFVQKHKQIKAYEIATQEHLSPYFVAGAWMFYGEYMAFNVLKEYENKQGIKYDFVFSLRVDNEIRKEQFDKNLLLSHQDGFYNFGYWGGGSSFAKRDLMQIYTELIAYTLPCFSKIQSIYDNHGAAPLWSNLNGVRYHLDNTINGGVFHSRAFDYILPNLSQELKKDEIILKQKGYTKAQIQSFKDFFILLEKTHKKPPKNVLIFPRIHYIGSSKTSINAINIVQSSLEFRTGKTLLRLRKKLSFWLFALFYFYQLGAKIDFEKSSIQRQRANLPFLNLLDYTHYPQTKEAFVLTQKATFKLGENFLILKEKGFLNLFALLNFIFKTYQNRHLKSFFKDYNKAHCAVNRVRNQLSYKLGFAMIQNSKQLTGLLKLPFILVKIKREHRQKIKIYNKLVQQFTNLTLPRLENCPDYNKALKLKNHLSFKLGQALIKASNNAWGGGISNSYFGMCLG